MVYQENEMMKWKREQIEYFKRYAQNFNNKSREYNNIMKGIEELEKTL